jgi:hypothetical protein
VYNLIVDSIFLLKLVLSFCIGGLWIVIATVLADKLGSKVGGLVSGLPSTVMFSLFFIAWTQSPAVAVQATTISPITGGLTCLFLTCYATLVHKGFVKATITSLALWLLLSYVLIRIHFNNYPLSILGYIVLFALSFFIQENILHIKSVKGKRIVYTPMLILSRGIIGGSVVALAVFLGKIGGPLLGGMFAMFPAMFMSTMLVTYYSHGSLFSSATMKSSMVSAISVTVYSIIARYTYVPFGLWFGTLASILVSFGTGALIYKLVITKLN